jgi:hypothetical protein
MSTESIIMPGTLFCGIDVSAVSLAVAIQSKISSPRNETSRTMHAT